MPLYCLELCASDLEEDAIRRALILKQHLIYDFMVECRFCGEVSGPRLWMIECNNSVDCKCSCCGIEGRLWIVPGVAPWLTKDYKVNSDGLNWNSLPNAVVPCKRGIKDQLTWDDISVNCMPYMHFLSKNFKPVDMFVESGGMMVSEDRYSLSGSVFDPERSSTFGSNVLYQYMSMIEKNLSPCSFEFRIVVADSG